MIITDEAKLYLEDVMEQNNAKNIRVYLAGMG